MKKVGVPLILGLFLSSLLIAQQGVNPFTTAKGKKRILTKVPYVPALNQSKVIIKSTLQQHSPYKNEKIDIQTIPFHLKTLEINRSTNDKLPIFIKGTIDSPLQRRANVSIEEKSIDYLVGVKKLIAIDNPRNEFKIKSIQNDVLGQQHIKLQQKYKGIPVYASEVILHSKNNIIDRFNGRYFPTPIIENINPTLSKTSASTISIKDLSKTVKVVEMNAREKNLLGYEKPSVELIIFHTKGDIEQERLAYHVTVRPNLMGRWEYFIDAHTGEVLNKYDHTCSFAHKHSHEAHEHEDFFGPTTASGTDLNNQNQNLRTYEFQGTYYMMDGSRAMFNGDFNNPEGAIVTLDLQNTNLQDPNYREITSNNNTWSDRSAVSAHYNSGIAFEYYLNTHNRTSIDGQGGNIVSFIHVNDENGQAMDNAFWNGQFIFYGDGKQAFSPLAGALDVAGHELTHGVISKTANLVYQGESGAINESMADVFGAMMDRDDWKIGEDVTNSAIFPTGALRDMANPNNGGNSLNDNGYQPDHMNDKYTGNQDNGGVHINSGIPNNAYYRFATSIGKNKAEKVFYRALTTYLTRSSQFIDLRLAVVQAASDLYGTTEVNAAKSAFDAVGITDGNGGSYEEDIEENPGQDFILSYDVNFSGNAKRLYISDTQGTQSSFVAISETRLNNKPSIPDDGSYAYFVSEDFNIHRIELQSPYTETVISQSPDWFNVAISKDGTKLAAVSKFADDNKISVFDLVEGGNMSFTLTNPTYSEGVQTGDVKYADALEWDLSGQFILYDAYSEIESNTGADPIGYWDVGFLRAWDNEANDFSDGNIQKMFASLPEGVSIGNPSFSKNSNYIVAFDYFEENDPSNTNDNVYELLASNIETNNTQLVFTNIVLSYPNYSKSDNRMIFNTRVNSSGQLDLNGEHIVAGIGIQNDKISPSGNPSVLIGNAEWGIWYSTGERNLPSPTNDIPEIDGDLTIYPNPFKDQITLRFESLKSTDASITLFNVLGEKLSSFEKRLSIGTNQFDLSLTNLSAGYYFLQLRVEDGFETIKILKQ